MEEKKQYDDVKENAAFVAEGSMTREMFLDLQKAWTGRKTVFLCILILFSVIFVWNLITMYLDFLVTVVAFAVVVVYALVLFWSPHATAKRQYETMLIANGGETRIIHCFAENGIEQYNTKTGAHMHYDYLRIRKMKMSIALPVVSAADDTSSETYVTEIKGANMTIGQDLSLNYYATLADEHKDATMHFVMSNGKEVDVKGVYDDNQGVYKFTLNAIPPQTMGDTIDATLKLGDTVLDEHIGYSVKAYAQSQFTKYPNDAELKQLLTDMLYYGEAAQLYRNYEIDALVTNDVQGIGTPSDESILPTESGMLNQVNPNTMARFTSAGVWFDYNNRLYIKFNATEGVTVKVNGEAVTFDGAMYNTNGIYAVDFDKVYTFELYEGETLANRIEYSIKAYVYNTMNKKDEDGQLTNMAKLVRALYAYGKSAEAYRDAKPENVIVGDNSATTIVIPTLDNKVSSAVSMSTENGAITAYVPAGVALATDTDMLTLKVNDMADSKAEISLEKTESAFSINVHIDGISANNDVATKITIKELLPVGLNMGNYRFYHVENGETVEMILLADGATPVHNNFEYDPATGDVVLYLTSFSEIALVADTKNAWNGEYDYTWYDVDKKELTIANADQLAAFGAIVGGMAINVEQEDDTTKTIERDSFKDKTVKLLADINLGDAEKENNSNIIFYPIGYYNSTGSYEKTSGETVTSEVYSFEGTFDGNGNTISNFYQNTWEMKGDYNDGYPAGSNHYKDAMGLFGYVNGGTIKNLTVDNFSTDGEFTPTGVIAAYAVNSTFENIAITNCNPRVYNTGNGGIIGIAGSTSAVNDDHIVLKNITVDNSNKISALWGSWDVACGGLVGMFRGNGNLEFNNCHVAAQIDVNNDVCANYQYYWYRYAGMFIGSVRKNTISGGYTVADTTGITATGCTYTLGDWNEYWYCELVANSLASYTHDHQFSRLTKIKDISEIQDEHGNWDTEGNFVIPAADNKSATCYHVFKKADGALYQHVHNVADESNPNIYEDFDLNGDGKLNDLKEDRTCYFMPFNQILNGDGYGVKPTYKDELGDEIDIKEKEDGVVKSEDKFEALSTITTYKPGQTITLGELVESIVDDTKLSKASIFAAVSPATENDNVSATYTLNPGNWKNSTITFAEDSIGSAKIVITDYFYCNPTVIHLNEEQSVEKFTANIVTERDAYTQITLGELFELNQDVSISGNVTATVTDPNDNETTVTGTNADWASQTIDLTKDGTWTVVIKDDDEYCAITTATFTVNKVDKFEKKFDKDFLYRVGNGNEVKLDSLFSDNSPDIAPVNLNVSIANVAGNAGGTFTENDTTWTNGTIQFTGTGVVKVTISANGANDLVLNLEVVDAYNRTTASFSGNSVLLNDVSTSSTLSTSGVLYGNGFTINMENAPISEKNGAVFHLYDGAILKNVKIVGKEFTSVATTVNDTNYGVSTVRAWGTVLIENCYISGCRAAVSVTGSELTIKDSVIANGVYANVDFRSGILNLHNVTTVNEPHAVNGTIILGLGIVGNMTASAGRQLNITGTLTQYNWVSQEDCSNIKASGVNSIFNSVFTDDKYASLRYTYNGTTYVNAGILSLCSDFGASAVTGIPTEYGGMDVSASIGSVTADGYVWAPAQAGTLSDDDMAYHDKVYEWTSKNQGTSYIPSAFAFTDAGLTAENGVVQIEYESGSSYTLTAETIKNLLPATKYGQSLSYQVMMGGEDYTDEDIVFDATASQTYTITYTITDNLVYDKEGKLTNTTYEVTKDLKVFATVVDKGADAPTFTFYYGTNGSASAGTPHTTQPTNSYTSTIMPVGEDYYIMPKVTTTTANAIGSQTIDNQTIYYPIVDGINVRSGNSTDYDFTRYYPIFKAIKISDNGTEYSYSGTKEMPDTIAWVSATIDSGNGASSLNDGFGLYNNQYLCKIQKKAGDAESGGTSVVKFSYTALDGNTYYYYVGFRFYDEDEGGVCIPPDTLVTLADGTQVRVDSLTGNEELLVWNHETGKLDKAPVAYIVNHDNVVSEREIIHLTFANGKTVKIIGEHVFFDATLNQYVAIDTKNVDAFIGHAFVSLKADGTSVDKTELVSVSREITETTVYEVVSYKHLTCFTEGILSTSAFLDPLLNVFDINSETLAYDAEKVQHDIETYGLYTYADFEGLISEEAFELYNAAYLKIAVGKGYITWDDILELIDIYFNVGVTPIEE